MSTPRQQQIANIKTFQRRVGLLDDGDFGPKTTARALAVADLADVARAVERGDTMPAGASLEERATAWCEREAEEWGTRQVSLERVAEYFRTCEQNGSNDKGADLSRMTLAGQRLSFCAAAQGFAEFSSLVQGDKPMPSRAGAKEYKADAEARIRGPWIPVSRVIAGAVRPPPRGSLVIYDRPSTAVTWDGHVERVCSSDERGYLAVGANENNRRWVLDEIPRFYQNERTLMGFVYPRGYYQ